jgi:hypothetical protein
VGSGVLCRGCWGYCSSLVSWVRALRSFWACGVDLLLLVNTLRSFLGVQLLVSSLLWMQDSFFFSPPALDLLGIIFLSGLVHPGCVWGLSLLLFHGYVFLMV